MLHPVVLATTSILRRTKCVPKQFLPCRDVQGVLGNAAQSLQVPAPVPFADAAGIPDKSPQVKNRSEHKICLSSARLLHTRGPGTAAC